MPAKRLDTLDVRNRGDFRKWLKKYHDSSSEIWLVFHKRHTSVASVKYEDAVEEALCFGWIDSIIRRLDDARYARKFTPPKADSKWSIVNRRRYKSLESRGLLAPPGLKRPPTNRSGGTPKLPLSTIPSYITKVLKANPRAWQFFEHLAPSYGRAYVAWIHSAKRVETREKRLREAVSLLAAGEKLGLK